MFYIVCGFVLWGFFFSIQGIKSFFFFNYRVERKQQRIKQNSIKESETYNSTASSEDTSPPPEEIELEVVEDFQVVRVDNSSPCSIDIDALLEPEPEECKSYFCCYAVKDD